MRIFALRVSSRNVSSGFCGRTGTVMRRELHTSMARPNSINKMKDLLSQAMKEGGSVHAANAKSGDVLNRGNGDKRKSYDRERTFKDKNLDEKAGSKRNGERYTKGKKNEKMVSSGKRGHARERTGGKNEKRDYKNNRGEGSFRKDRERENKRQLLAFLETGNDRDKAAAKRIITEALKENKKGLVQVIKERGVVEVVQVVEAFQGMDLSEKGIVIVGNRNIKSEDDNKHGLNVGDKLLILKVVERQLCIKQYGDHLSELATAKLRLKNSVILDKQKKKKDDGGKGEVKVVQIGWNINLNDLTGQKKFEMESHIKKGNDVDIVIDEKEYLDKDNLSFNNGASSNETSDDRMQVYRKRRKQLTEVEKTMRQKMLGIIDDNLRGIDNLPEAHIGDKKGFIESRMILRVKGITGKDKDTAKKDRKEQKQLEKAQKAEKQRQRREERERREKESMKELVV